MHMETSSASEAALSSRCIEATAEDLRLVRNRELVALEEDVKYRLAIYHATQNASLALQGFDALAPSGLDLIEVLATLCGELSRRLRVADVCITEELHRHMLRTPGLPTWTHRGLEGRVFYVGKVWAVAEAAGIDLTPLVCDPFLEAL